MSHMYADVIIDISHEKVDRPFQYIIPDEMLDALEVGMCVQIPFGKGNTLREGYVIGITEETDYPEDKLKSLIRISPDSNQVQSRYIRLAWWIKNHYGSTMIAALKVVLPVKQKAKALELKQVSLKVNQEQARELMREAGVKKQNGKVRLLSALLESQEVNYTMLTTKLGILPQTIRSMQEQCIVHVETYHTYRNPIQIGKVEREEKQLTDMQADIVAEYLRRYDEGDKRPALLHGITGSGKTEVYLSLIQGMLDRKKQCIVLIPEIALTYQTVMRFYKRFGDVVSIMNSRLSPGEKSDQIERVKSGEIQIMIGPRSALFTPFENLGLILIDEEHETSYKSDSMPRFHAREVACQLASLTDAGVFLGSATPSLEAYHRAVNGIYQKFELTERIGESKLPEVQIVDLRQELKNGNFSIFSRALQEAMQERLDKKEQIMLFLNRRGLAGFVSCRGCGYVMKCPHCDVSLTEHRTKMVCHYCGYETEVVKKCPECGSGYIRGFKAGTQQIEDAVVQMFPKARVLRMDADTTKKKDDHEKILAAFSNEEADVLVGTQMIVKGHDFPNVTLVGILAADLSLLSSDYRSAERTFQLLTQAVGRAGRKDKPGNAIIQTYQPDHYSVELAAKQDYRAFYEMEYGHRELMDYPPAQQLLAVLFVGKVEGYTDRIAKEMVGQIKKQEWILSQRIRVIGPAPASIGKINDMFRFVVYFKAKDERGLIRVKNEMEAMMDDMEEALRTIAIHFDFNPMNGY